MGNRWWGHFFDTAPVLRAATAALRLRGREAKGADAPAQRLRAPQTCQRPRPLV
jgi:hypothetical protein